MLFSSIELVKRYVERLLQQTDNNQCILNTTLGNLMLVSKTILRNYISFKHFVMRGLDST